MQIQQASRDEPETIDVMVLNADGDTVVSGMGMRFVGGVVAEVNSADGINATKITAAQGLVNFAGVVLEDIPANRHGLVRAYGKVETILYSTILGGNVGPSGIGALVPSAVAGQWTSTGAVSVLGYLQSWVTTNMSAFPPEGSGFVRAIR